MTFDLRALIQEVLDETSLTDPDDIADEVFRRTPRTRVADAYRATLRQYVRLRVMLDRSRRLSGRNTTGQPPNGSAKVRGIREAHWQRALRSRIHTGETYAMLGDCTYEYLMFAAEERRSNAKRNLAVADMYERLAQLLEKHGAKHVRDLPEPVLSAELGGKAA